jgi:NADH:ubiquinone oxidoreductase subunit C
MDNQALLNILSQAIPNQQITEGKQFIELTIAPDELHSGMMTLKSNPQLQFDFLVCQTGVDLNQQLGVVYHLRSTQLGHCCVVKSLATNRENAQLPTVSDLWPTAQYFEREIFDLVGIHFTNHPNMKRIFLEDDFIGHPFRKDYEDPINIITKQ